MRKKVFAYLHSKKVGEKQGEQEIVEIISSVSSLGTTTYMVLTEDGKRCTAIFNPLTCAYYADDIYGVLPKAEGV